MSEQRLALNRQFAAFADSYDDMNFTAPLLSTIRAETLIVHGDRDRFFPVSIPVAEYDAIPDSYLWIVPNGEHIPLIGTDRGDRVLTENVLEFFGGDWR
jgi:pimeloyl-ACP methyl ester carboxylesterase